jgi:hypothetical protein
MQNPENSFTKKWFDEVWNDGNENAIDQMVHPEAKVYGLGEPLVGAAQFKPFYHAFRKDYSNIHVKVDRVYTIGNTEIAMCTVNATHNASGNKVHFQGVCETKLENGKIIEGHNLFDFLTMNLQAGKVKPEQLG